MIESALLVLAVLMILAKIIGPYALGLWELKIEERRERQWLDYWRKRRQP